MLILGIESSCDESSVSLVLDGKTVLSNQIYSQVRHHKKLGGVVPDLASRLHEERLNLLLEASYLSLSIRVPSMKPATLVGISSYILQDLLVAFLSVSINFGLAIISALVRRTTYGMAKAM